ncbi:MAG: helix-turn-helix domain-containing protein [Micromonosporaceae bacterium]|nr:helix-turn-helix domain-containing protein [Micromonosporaceae bacterium]
MILLRRVLGDALRARRLDQDRTLRDVSTAANVSLGYLSEIERGQKEASSELLGSICDALDTRLSEVLREAGGTLALAEEMAGMLVPAPGGAEERADQTAGPGQPVEVTDSLRAEPARQGVQASLPASIELTIERPARADARPRDVVCAA